MAEAAAAMACPWDTVLELTKMAQDRGTDPLVYSFQISSTLNAAGVSIPSPDFAAVLVSHICWSNNVSIAWKFLEKALTLRVVPPLSVLALLSTRVIPNRKIYPVAYRLYMELMKRYIFSLKSLINGSNYQQIMESVDQTLSLSQTFGLPDFETGLVLVEFIFKTVWELVDASLDDEGLLELSAGKESMWPIRTQDMEIDNRDACDGKRVEQNELFLKMNTTLATEIVGEFFQNKVTSKILYLARRNMPSYWEPFIQNLQLLASNSTAIRNLKSISPEALLQLTCDTDVFLSRDGKTSTLHRLHAVVDSSLASFASRCHGTSPSAYWLPIDLFLEDSLDGSQVIATSAAETLTVLVKALQAVNCTTWQDTFLGLWVAALRLVQRERHLSEGPVPRLDTCLCMVLSITPLAIANIIEEEESELNLANQGKSSSGQRRQALISSLKQLDDYEGLLTPPLQVVSVANQAAAKAMMFLSGMSVSSGYFDGISLNDMPLNCAGNLRHLVVEACIARNVLDTSAYFWPGYVKGRCNQIPCGISGQVPGWSSLMKGSPLTPPMMSVLVSTPASSLAELEKIYEFAVNGSDEEKISAATVLCGASLTRGWNIQEHIVMFITRLLSPPVPKDHTGCESHLIGCAPFLNVLLVGISSIDCMQTLSLHGLVPQLAGALMPICEVFGSCAPTVSWAVTREELSSHAVFSNAFTLLLKLWRFDEPPFESATGELSRVTPEYLLLVRNRQLASNNQFKCKQFSRLLDPWPSEPVFMDSFPKLKCWYRQNLACLCSTLSGLVHGTPVHQLVEALLSFMFRKLSRGGGQPLTPPTTSGSSSSSGPGDELSDRLKVPAWDILEALPFALDAALTACAHGRLSPRELTTGIKDLADFLPASLATIISYFSAEVTRGLWKPASMNGTDWPSPAANLALVEQQIKKTLAATGVHVPSLPVDGSSVSTLPLPLAVLLSLTITYKLDRDTGRFLNFVGCSLNNLATVCPWPCMPIIVSLWAQKIKRWSDFLVFSASRTVFHHNRDAVVQLLRVCFKATLGLNNSITSTSGGVGALLGHGFVSHFSGSISPSAPGIMYLRVHRAVRNALFMTEEIVSLLMSTVGDVANPAENLERLKKTKHGLRYGQVSLVSALARLKLSASLGASLIWITGGLSLVQSLIHETLPSWFISVQKQEPLAPGVEMMRGHALAYFTVLCMAFALGVGPLGPRRSNVLTRHMEFLASALEGKISLGCNEATWRAYLSGFVSMMVVSTPNWVREVDVRVVKRLSKGLKQWKEEDLAVALLGVSGVVGMAEAAEMIILRRVE
ncbi:hypothetical protein DM860_012662 [Cuscuta australis]|uniref:Mediator of RNA polymerase II transcription subunit 33A n=1 Tax=Cuscuta australis TaxID=267555 RepID=A0A328DH86_9ASTE|nr:hypothetical protein DM860_012662 [Cuscuta australis]